MKESAAGEGFLAGIAKEWEAEAARAEFGGRECPGANSELFSREEGGALPKMVTPFKFGLADGWEAASSGCRGLRWKIGGELKLCPGATRFKVR